MADYCFIGMEHLFSGVWFLLQQANILDGETVTWEYWDGTTWSTLTVRDNCTDDATSPTIFAYNGVIEWDIPATWAMAYIIDIIPGSLTVPPDNPDTYANPYISKYWVRFTLSDIAAQPTLLWVREKPTQSDTPIYAGSYLSPLGSRRVTKFKVSGVSTPLVQEIGGTIYCTVLDVPNNFGLTRCRIYSDELGLTVQDELDIKILSNPGKYREAEAGTTGFGEPYVLYGMDGVQSELGPNSIWLSDVLFDPPLKIRDDLNTNNMYFLFKSPAELTADATFHIEISGFALSTVYPEHFNDNNPVHTYGSMSFLTLSI